MRRRLADRVASCRMLHLQGHTDPRWGEAAIACLDEILLDHAHCEKKAASTALSLVFRYADQAALAIPLSRLAREELEHFELVVGHIRRRNGEFRRLSPSPYAADLTAAVRSHEPARLVDTLLCCALIEARSCERMQILGRALADAVSRGDERVDRELVDLYDGLLASEARHFVSYVELAHGIPGVNGAEVEATLVRLAKHEAAVTAAAPVSARMHANLRSP